MVVLILITQEHMDIINVTIFIVEQVQVIKDMVHFKKKKKKKFLTVQHILDGLCLLRFISINLNQIIIVQILYITQYQNIWCLC